MTKTKLLPITADQREISRLRQSLMDIAIEARCWTPHSEHQEQTRNRIIRETERALGLKK